jgi:hypothetical protein
MLRTSIGESEQDKRRCHLRKDMTQVTMSKLFRRMERIGKVRAGKKITTFDKTG